jgi:hypothetical protein
MTCREAEDLFSACLEGGLGRGDERRLRAHLEACPACALLFEATRDVISQLQALPEIEIPVPEGLNRRIFKASEKPPTKRLLVGEPGRSAASPGLAAAAVIILAFFLNTLLPITASPRFYELYTSARTAAEDTLRYSETVFARGKDEVLGFSASQLPFYDAMKERLYRFRKGVKKHGELQESS